MSLENDKPKRPALEQKATDTVKRYGILNFTAVVVGVSGGADSMALLNFLCSMREKTGIRVYAAHINHGIRGDEAARDENFVCQWCKREKVDCFVLHADVKAQAAECGETVEEAGRRVRYEFFEQNAKKLGAAIATAHTLSDSIETQIMNLARGTGLRGLCGIPPVRGDVIRPLIRCTRSDTEEYCQFYGIEYVNDSTNFSHDYTRNRVRLDIIPKLYEINPAFDRAAERLFTILEEEQSCLEEQVSERLAAALVSPGVYSLDLLSQGCQTALLKRCAASAAAQFTGVAQEAGHINAIADIILHGSGKVEIKGGCFVLAKQGKLIFTWSDEKMSQTGDFVFPFKPGTYQNGIFELKISDIFEFDQNKFKKFNKRYFNDAIDCDKIRDNAVIRAKIQGDKFSPAGRNATKTLKKLFNEVKIPIDERSFVPVAVDGEGVLWVGSFGVSERCKVTEGTKNAVLLEIKRLEV